MKFTDLILGLLILFVGGTIGIVFFVHEGLTLPIIEKDTSKFFGLIILPVKMALHSRLGL